MIKKFEYYFFAVAADLRIQHLQDVYDLCFIARFNFLQYLLLDLIIRKFEFILAKKTTADRF